MGKLLAVAAVVVQVVAAPMGLCPLVRMTAHSLAVVAVVLTVVSRRLVHRA